MTGEILDESEPRRVMASTSLGASFGDATDDAGMRDALMAQLAPATVYEAFLAHNIVELELGYLASRKNVAGILRGACRDLVWQTVLRMTPDEQQYRVETEARDVALAFVRCDAAADEALAKLGLTRGDIEAQAYRENWILLREIDQIQARFETRRTALMADYRGVQASRNGGRVRKAVDVEEVI